MVTKSLAAELEALKSQKCCKASPPASSAGSSQDAWAQDANRYTKVTRLEGPTVNFQNLLTNVTDSEDLDDGSRSRSESLCRGV